MVVDADERSLASLCDCHLPEARTQSCLRAPPAHADQSTVTDASDRAEREHQIVHCRIRPVLPFDEESDDPGSHASPAPGEVAHAVDDETVQVKCSRPGHPPINKTFTFERVYRPADPQREVFGDVRPLLTSLLDGLISENPSRRAKVEVSIVEVYNDDIFDLLAEDTCTATPGVKCEVLTTKEGRKEVSPLTCTSVRSAQECMMLVGAGLQLRAMRATSAHAHSSRSHLIITVALTTTPAWDSSAEQGSDPSLLTEPGRPWPQQPVAGRRRHASPRASSGSPGAPPGGTAGHTEQVHAKLQLVDLAGSECAGVSGVTGSALRETSFINRSLAALADVLGALSERRGHIPYRNSKLTHVLQDALGNWCPPVRAPRGVSRCPLLLWEAGSSQPHLLRGPAGSRVSCLSSTFLAVCVQPAPATGKRRRRGQKHGVEGCLCCAAAHLG
ncbi:PREDICTED: kinesin-like protein KIF25 isoform X5 [Hipposideros armiger]|uniref:Kinesin-like protein n=1 Tax=Hipposideros armiger TaxID=186990 RepID=A0A8B7SS20_HIPAR|nr:PREDICTED: kinesin-like protein KIF25 isoform X5 [Hipposideros armiger]